MAILIELCSWLFMFRRHTYFILILLMLNFIGLSSYAQCIDFTNLNSPCVTAYYGTYNNPMAHTGVVDYGSNSINSRHTVNTNIDQYDSRTNNQLRVIPQGYIASVRLGNWGVNCQAESIVYDYIVDTSDFDMLILKYAAVLEDPDHFSSIQPKFQFQVTDSMGVAINSLCYSATFIANSSLGWNQVPVYWDWSSHQVFDHYLLWKDWTTVGVDLTPLHGQKIKIQLTTYDCNEGAHYGYAYFVLDCGNKKLISTNCGQGNINHFTAPDGFNYLWYEASNPNDVLSNSQSYDVIQPGEYHCRCSFIGAPTNNCYFDIMTIAGNRYPTANYYSEVIDSIGCDSIKVNFTNTSYISHDLIHSDTTHAPCENILWIIDGNATTYKSPTVTFGRGNHTVSLIASLSGGLCTDTLTRTYSIMNLCAKYDTICNGEVYQLYDTALRTPGYFERDSLGTQLAVSLFVQNNDTTFVYDTIVENDLPYLFLDTLFSDSTTNAPFHFENQKGCDSLVNYSLYVHRNVVSRVDTVVCEEGLPFIWNDSVFTTAGSKISRHANVGTYGEDSIIVMNVSVLSDSVALVYDTIGVNYLPVVRYGATLYTEQVDTVLYAQTLEGCLLTIHYNLHIVYNTFEHIDSTVCENQLPIVWLDSVFVEESTKTIVYTSVYGADSVIELSLHVNPSYYNLFYDTLNENQSYLWGNQIITAPGAYYDTMQSINGCDSVFELSTILFKRHDSTVCDNQFPIVWCDSIFFSGGTKRIVFDSDSIVEISLHTNPSYTTFDTLAFCIKDTGEYIYHLPGDYQESYSTIEQCDSIVELHVTIYPDYYIHAIDSFCESQVYSWRNMVITAPGNYYDSLQTSNGCDSVLGLILTIMPNSHTVDRVQYCQGATYLWEDGVRYSYPTEVPTIIYPNIYGCDSIVRLSLTFPYDTFRVFPYVSPQIATFENNIIYLIDNSESYKREWSYCGTINHLKSCCFSYPMEDDSVEVMLRAENIYGCRDSSHIIVRLDKSLVWAPNVFTPDKPSNNSFLFVLNDIEYAEAWIFDRNGLFISHFDAMKDSWDGTSHGIRCPQAAYVWKLRYSSNVRPEQFHETIGTVLLLR